MSESSEPIFVVSVELPDHRELHDRLLEMLSGTRVVLLGTYVVSEQTSPEQARDEFEESAREELEGIEERFREAGQVIETRLVFTPDRSETLSRMEDELRYDAIVIPGRAVDLERVLVAISGRANFDRLKKCLRSLLRGGEQYVTLLNMAESEDDEGERELVLKGLREYLVEMGVDGDRVTVESSSSDDPVESTREVADDYDLVVLAEREETIIDSVFGRAWELVAESFEGPAIVVRLDEDS